MVLLSVMLPGVVRAQGGYTSLSYLMGFGTGELGDYVSKGSFRGVSFEYQKALSSNFSAGVEVAWNVFYERKDYDSYSKDNITLSGVQYRYSNNLPMLVTAEYILKPDGVIKPYVNFGLGTIYNERHTQMGTWAIQEKVWQFALKPELGFFYEVSYNTSVDVSVKYYTGFGNDSMDGQSYLGVSAGLVFAF